MLELLRWSEPFRADLLAFTASVLLLLLYHAVLRYKLHRNPFYTVQAVNAMARTAWVSSVMEGGGGQAVLAVQTLRNSTMAATFLASTAVLLLIGVMTLTGRGAELAGTWHALNVFGSRHPEVWLLKLLVLLLDLFVVFFSFTLSVRVYNHVGYLINVPLHLNIVALNPAHVAVHLNRAGRYYSIGMRAFYFSVPLVFWLFGPHFLVGATLALITVLRIVDRAPRIDRALGDEDRAVEELLDAPGVEAPGGEPLRVPKT